MNTNTLNTKLVWKGNYPGSRTIEVLQFTGENDCLQVKSLVSGMLNGQPILVEYFVGIDKNWKVQRVSLNSLLDDGKSFLLKSGPDEKWYDASDNEIPELTGCIDIDISITPFTNTLPIRRLNDALIERTKIMVLYFNLNDWRVEKVEQYYTKLSDHLYKYEGVFRDFVAELPVDNFGFVTTYPDLFERLYPV